jgi:ATP-binding cassette, subfamily G (WHITE), member 2, PDR
MEQIFEKVTVLYEGRQIYFGRTQDAKDFFIAMGFECPKRQTTADFLTSLTSPIERIVRPGFEDRVPRTADEFAAAWKGSVEFAQLMVDVEDYYDEFTVGGESVQDFENSRRVQQARRQ